MEHAQGNISVVIVDDHAPTRKFLAMLLEDSGMRVVGQAANGYEGVRLCAQLRPSVVVLDISMPLLNGFGVAQRLASFAPGCKIIFTSSHTIKEYAVAALRAGGTGFVFKDHAIQDLPDAIAAALDGRHYVSRSAA